MKPHQLLSVNTPLGLVSGPLPQCPRNREPHSVVPGPNKRPSPDLRRCWVEMAGGRGGKPSAAQVPEVHPRLPTPSPLPLSGWDLPFMPTFSSVPDQLQPTHCTLAGPLLPTVCPESGSAAQLLPGPQTHPLLSSGQRLLRSAPRSSAAEGERSGAERGSQAPPPNGADLLYPSMKTLGLLGMEQWSFERPGESRSAGRMREKNPSLGEKEKVPLA